MRTLCKLELECGFVFGYWGDLRAAELALPAGRSRFPPSLCRVLLIAILEEAVKGSDPSPVAAGEQPAKGRRNTQKNTFMSADSFPGMVYLMCFSPGTIS